jgi:hypothetical protein
MPLIKQRGIGKAVGRASQQKKLGSALDQIVKHDGMATGDMAASLS